MAAIGLPPTAGSVGRADKRYVKFCLPTYLLGRDCQRVASQTLTNAVRWRPTPTNHEGGNTEVRPTMAGYAQLRPTLWSRLITRRS